MASPLRVVILKPRKYTADGYVERFRWGFMPNSTVPYLRSMTPSVVGHTSVEVQTVDEYVHTDLQYLSLLNRPRGGRTLLALVGVQSHQFHRALDLAAYARRGGCMVVIGGPHVMTCDTSMLHDCGVSFALLGSGSCVGRDPGRRGPGRNAACVWPAATMAARVGIADHRAAWAQGPAQVRHADAGALPGSRVSVRLQFLLGNQNRRTADSQPEYCNDYGQPSRRQSGRRADDHVHFRQL